MFIFEINDKEVFGGTVHFVKFFDVFCGINY